MELTNKIFILLTLTIALGCKNAGKKSDSSNRDTSQVSINETPDYNSLLPGKWHICSKGGSNGEITQYNVCLEIVFNANYTAFIFLNKDANESMHWEVKNDTLFINHWRFFSKDSSQHFPDFKYIIIKTEDSISVNLELRQLEKNYFSNLSRPKHTPSTEFNFQSK